MSAVDFSISTRGTPPDPSSDRVRRRWALGRGVSAIRLSRSATKLQFRFPDQTTFVYSFTDRRICAWPVRDASAETVRHHLLDQVLPRLLAHDGRLVLHGGSISIAGSAIAFVGGTGLGKSTLVASLAAAGHELLCDDGLVLGTHGDTTMVRPTYRSLRLWPEAVTKVFAQPPTVAPMAHYSTKRRVQLSGAGGPLDRWYPLTAVFAMEPAAPDDDGITLCRMPSRDACMTLIRNAFQLDPSDREQARRLLAAAADVAERVPAFTLAYPRDFAMLPKVRATVLQSQAEWATATAEGG